MKEILEKVRTAEIRLEDYPHLLEKVEDYKAELISLQKNAPDHEVEAYGCEIDQIHFMLKKAYDRATSTINKVSLKLNARIGHTGHTLR